MELSKVRWKRYRPIGLDYDRKGENLTIEWVFYYLNERRLIFIESFQ